MSPSALHCREFVDVDATFIVGAAIQLASRHHATELGDSQVRQMNEALDQPLVLVVDDDQELCNTLWDLFRERGLRVHVARDFHAAVERLRTNGFNVVLVDFRLPKESGIDVLRAVREQNRQASSRPKESS